MNEPADIADALRTAITRDGPMPVATFMARANAHYYATRDPFGAGGDFVTAPEISQMFGELVGLCLADLWTRGGAPANACYVELGPGRGTLAADALRAMAAGGFRPDVHLVETSPSLRSRQRERLPAASWHDSLEALPEDRPLLLVANEFFDALPVRQFVRTIAGWRERMVTDGPDGFAPTAGGVDVTALVPVRLRDAPVGSILERGEAAAALATGLARRIARQGGALLAIDYGYRDRAAGDTLQAVSAHAYADPFARPGAYDLTAHVDFSALAAALRAGGAEVSRIVPQGEWLLALGLAHRAATLARATPARGDEIAGQHRRLVAPEEMGELFKVVAATAPGWPTPAGL